MKMYFHSSRDLSLACSSFHPILEYVNDAMDLLRVDLSDTNAFEVELCEIRT